MNVLKSEIPLLYEKIFANEFYLSLICFRACKLTDTAKFEQQMYTPVVVYVYSNRTNCTHKSYMYIKTMKNFSQITQQKSLYTHKNSLYNICI